MAKTNLDTIAINANTTFQTWLDKTNELVTLLSTDVVTVSLLPGGDTTIGNATIEGIFTANTIIGSTDLSTGTIRGLTSGANINFTDPARFVTESTQNVATFLNASGPRTRYSTPTVDWNVGLETGTADTFIISTGIGDAQFRLTSSGNLTITGAITATNGITGTITEAIRLLNPRTIEITGDLSYTSAAFDGTGNVSGVGTISSNAVTNDKFRQSAGLSIVGRSASSTGNIADITAASDHQVLRRSGSTIGFGAIALNQGAAVTGILGIGNGGTGSGTQAGALSNLGGQPLAANLTAISGLSTNGFISRTGSGTAAIRSLAAGSAISISNGDGVSGNPTISVSGLTTSQIAAATLVTAAEGINANNTDTTLPTSAAVKSYVDSESKIKAFLNMSAIPLNGTYTRTDNIVTITMTSHGMVTGQYVQLDFTTGAATDGYYEVTVVGPNTFTIIDSASGTTSGAVSRLIWARKSNNISNVSRIGTGNYRITFTTPIPDSFYIAIGSVGGLTVGGDQRSMLYTAAQTTTTIDIGTIFANGVYVDNVSVHFAIIY